MSDAMEFFKELPRYRCHKEVQAMRIHGIKVGKDAARLLDEEGNVRLVSTLYIDKHNPHIGGYYVVYKDGYQSFSPADAFESGYTLID